MQEKQFRSFKTAEGVVNLDSVQYPVFCINTQQYFSVALTEKLQNMLFGKLPITQYSSYVILLLEYQKQNRSCKTPGGVFNLKPGSRSRFSGPLSFSMSRID